MPECLKNTCFKEDIKHHRYISLSLHDKVLLFFHYYLPCLMRVSCWQKRHILTRMLRLGRKKVYKNLNVFKVSQRLIEIIFL